MRSNQARKIIIEQYHLIDSVMINERQLQIVRRLKQKRKTGVTRLALARFMMCNESTLHHDLKAMLEKGYITKQKDPNTNEMVWRLRDDLA
jgi:DNA-binding MarR family transcriptional regulator